MGNFYGIPGVKYISHGEWSDPEVEYKGYTFNYWDVEDSLYDLFKQEFEPYEDDLYVSKDTGEVLSFEDWLNQNKDLVYGELDDFVAFSKYDYDDIADDDYFDDDGYYSESNKISEAYWENERNPQIKYKAEVKYKLFNDDDFDTFSDTYYIDSDYSLDEVESYITRDILLVCGGGYNTKNIEKATVKINGKVVYELDNTKTESKNRGKKKVSENQDYNCYTGIYHIRNITEYAQDELVSIGKRYGFEQIDFYELAETYLQDVDRDED